MADMPVKSEGQKQSRSLRWRWRVFWDTRSGWRMVWGLILAIPPLLALIYLVLPSGDQTQVVAALQTMGQALGATGLRVAIEVALVGCALASFALLLAPGYRKARYLRLPTSVIPPITVYVDAENINDRGLLDTLVEHLRRDYLAGGWANSRADLLFFMDAAHTGTRVTPDNENEAGRKPRLNWVYEALYLNGFRLVDSPHNPTGKAKMLEAADREIAMHALERALLGPAHQEFVIASGDGDFAPLIYRLIALGHSVQVWTWGETRAYRIVARYLPLTVYHLDTGVTASASSQRATGPGAASLPLTAGTLRAAPSGVTGGKAAIAKFTPRTPPEVAFPHVGMAALYSALYNTVELCGLMKNTAQTPSVRLARLNTALGDSMKPGLADVGYSGRGSSASWLRALTALHALRRAQDGFPQRGPTTPAEAARPLYFMALAIAQAAARAVSTRPDHVIGMGEVIDQLAGLISASDDAAPVLAMMSPERDERYMDARYLVRCARALGLLQFDEAPDSSANIVAPRLTALAEQIIAEQAGGQPDATAGQEASV